MSLNIVTDPDELLRIEIPPNVIGDIERAVKRVEDLLPSIYRGLGKILDMARPWSPEQAIYYHELSAIKEILKFLDNPGVSYLIGVPFQPAIFEDDNVYTVVNMGVPRLRIEILGPTKCTVLVFPVTIMYPDIVLRSVFVHELVHCTIGDPHEIITYKVEKMLTDLAPDLFLTTQRVPKYVMRAIAEYLKQSRVPVMDLETCEAVIKRIRADPEYASQILGRSVIVWLRPSIFWRR